MYSATIGAIPAPNNAIYWKFFKSSKLITMKYAQKNALSLLRKLTSKTHYLFDDDVNNTVAHWIKLSKMQYPSFSFQSFQYRDISYKILSTKPWCVYLLASAKNFTKNVWLPIMNQFTFLLFFGTQCNKHLGLLQAIFIVLAGLLACKLITVLW